MLTSLGLVCRFQTVFHLEKIVLIARVQAVIGVDNRTVGGASAVEIKPVESERSRLLPRLIKPSGKIASPL